ncbi:GntR family transcriptional regulator [Pseudomonas sp. 250J]|uniref:GntR family transcriptional regulator n=1 Tax=Pseudomonas peradeniyensis TaxID=2745488 RepID=A0ABT2V9R8_9PSED|nr:MULTISPECIES: GntR family transcriptional regulator [Pseudomonas]KNX78360.1 GntR family transcriptional regulator [Pseudomonas sp. 250J]MCU7238464.1 GntR family transcriptional regulator [Pseudomonas peradeniyensis]MCU7281045.1 GntR family transcriptional regulator [Pseudomonas peradeniyensis]QZA52731.1 GntR family transcriptional regulator [Pseudomonas sp. 2hn]
MQFSIDSNQAARGRPDNLADRLYQQIKEDIFEFRLLPGDRFSEGEVATRMSVSRTPVRQALYRLEREGYLEVHFRSGWQVVPFDFERFEALYDLRIVLEQAAVRCLCDLDVELSQRLQALVGVWLVEEDQRQQDGRLVSELDEAFHCALVAATGNREMAQVHREVTEKIRIIRRLDFTQRPRVAITYEEHGDILRAILQRRAELACQLLRSHIEISKAEVRKITLHMLHSARQRLQIRRVTP